MTIFKSLCDARKILSIHPSLYLHLSVVFGLSLRLSACCTVQIFRTHSEGVFFGHNLWFTFLALVTVLSTCLNLKSLGLVFDATNAGPPPAGRSGGVCNTNITKFCVECSPIEKPPQVALALSQILPCLRNTKVDGWVWDANKQARMAKWGEVSDRIALIKQPGLRA